MHEIVPKNTVHFKSYFGLTFLKQTTSIPLQVKAIGQFLFSLH